MGELTADQVARRALWRELAEKGIEQGADWPRIVLTLFADIDHLAARLESLAEIVESFRKQNPMNGDGSNYTIDRILLRLVGEDERERLKRKHQDRWNQEYLELRAKLDAEERS
jgi:hypothetical protein